MTSADIDRIEATLGIEVPADYRAFVESQADEIRRLDEALDYVVTPWLNPDDIITANQQTPLPGGKRLIVAGNGAGDFWFLELAGDTNAIWYFEHETNEVGLAHDDAEAWLTYLSQRLDQQTTEAIKAKEKAAREFAELTFSPTGQSSLYDEAMNVESTARLAALIAAGHDANTPNRNKFAGTPLMGAVSRGNPPAVRLLLEAGADPNLVDSNENTALHSCGKPELAELLLQHGANPNAINSLGRTPLHGCGYFGRAEVAKLLLAHGADKTVTDNEGKTALGLAADRGKQNFIDLL